LVFPKFEQNPPPKYLSHIFMIKYPNATSVKAQQLCTH
jgi:hypothetical protein